MLCYDSCFIINSWIIYMSWCMTYCMEIICGFTFLIFVLFCREFGIRQKWSWKKVDQQREQLITEFADVPEEPQGPPPHRRHLDHKVKLIGYSRRQQRHLINAIDKLRLILFIWILKVCVLLSIMPYISISMRLYWWHMWCASL